MLNKLLYYWKPRPKYNNESINIFCAIQKYLNDSTNIIQSKIARVCYKLCLKILNHQYRYHIKQLNKKWGEIDTILVSSPCVKDKIQTDTQYNKLQNNDLKSLYELELIAALEMDEKHKQRDINLLFSMLAKYHEILSKSNTQ